jgi:hypothetical protein
LTRVSRLIVIGSLLAAGVVHAWLASGRPGLPSAVLAAFACGLAAGRRWPSTAVPAVLALTYVAPTLLFVVFGVSDYHTMMIWLAPLAGVTLAGTNGTAWHLPHPWRVPLVGWALVIAVSWPIVAARELDFSLLAARTYDTTTAAYPAPPRLAAAWILVVSITQLTCILWFDLLWSRFGRQIQSFERLVLVPLAASAIVGSLAGVYQAFVDLQWMNLDVWSRLGRAGALMLDANTAGMAAAIWAPVMVALVWRIGAPAGLGIGAYALCAGAMWAAGSRTALVAMIAGTGGLVVAVADRQRIPRRRTLMACALAALALTAAARAIGPQLPVSSPLRRVFDRLPDLEVADLDRFGSEMWDRFGYGRAAAAIIAEHPVSGVGIGAFHIVGTDYLRRDGRPEPVPDNAQNWWRHQVAELGWVGAVPSLWVSGLVGVALWRGAGSGSTPAAVVLSAVLGGVGAASLLGMPTQHPSTLLVYVTLLFWQLTLTGQTGTTPSRSAVQAQWATAAAIALIVALGLAWTAGDSLRVANRARRSQTPYSYGVSPPEGLSEYGEFRWVAQRAVAVLRTGGPWLQLTIWALHPDAETRPVEYRIWLEGRDVIRVEARSGDPVTYYLRMPADSDVAFIEVHASRELHPDRALQVATTWLREVPPGVEPGRIVER